MIYGFGSGLIDLLYKANKLAKKHGGNIDLDFGCSVNTDPKDFDVLFNDPDYMPLEIKKFILEHNLVDELRDDCEDYLFILWSPEIVQNSLQYTSRHTTIDFDKYAVQRASTALGYQNFEKWLLEKGCVIRNDFSIPTLKLSKDGIFKYGGFTGFEINENVSKEKTFLDCVCDYLGEKRITNHLD